MVTLGANQYGKAETRLVRITRDGPRHGVCDLMVGVTLAGDLAATHLTGDNSSVLPTDTQKNTVYVFAREHGIEAIEEFARLLACHFVDTQPTIGRARVHIEQYGWQRLGDHSFQRDGSAVRTATVSYDGQRVRVVSGVSDLVLMNTTDSEFHGFITDRYTTLPPTNDRVLATAVQARWRHGTDAGDWEAGYVRARQALVSAFVDTYSLSLQQTLYAMGTRVLQDCSEVVEVRLALPNRHHLLVNLAPFGLDNPGEVFDAPPRPYGLIEGTVLRDDAPDAGLAWW